MLNRPLSVGIMSATTIRFTLSGNYMFDGNQYEGTFSASLEADKVLFEGKQYDELLFEGGSEFTLHDVTIGVNFHWQRREAQTFVGALRIIVGSDKVLSAEKGLIAINLLDVEDYLTSVISSEMAATSSIELLKAHAVISRSWLLHPLLVENGEAKAESSEAKVENEESEQRHICWYERDAHRLFDVCADDHCQRYQGITRATSPNVQAAIDATRGELLLSDENGEVCDARFYKCCGGATEEFENCWADCHYSYLEAIRDSEDSTLPDLSDERQAQAWILSSPDAFCNTRDRRVLSEVLNNYDQETADFYRWTVVYTQEELSDIVRTRSGIDFGTIEALIPLKRGRSGRIIELRVVGSKREMTIGKELEIRKWLSRSHLYSSAFVVCKDYRTNIQTGEKTTTFVIRGAGWGHGVGLCQIGAAVMADKGYSYRQILNHYFPNTHLSII